MLSVGDLIRAVGSEESLSKMALVIGEKVDEELPMGDRMERFSGLVTNKKIVNVSLAELNLQQSFVSTVIRVRRSGIDITPSPSLTLKFGDKLTIVGSKDHVEELVKLLGNDKKQLSDTDFFPIALGVILGVLVGKISISFGGGITFSLGLTGGILLTSLILRAKGRTGNIIWAMSAGSTQLLRQLGLLLFLAGVGTSAGTTMVESLRNDGLTMFVAGLLITLVPMIIAALASKYIFKVNVVLPPRVIYFGSSKTLKLLDWFS